MTVANAIGPEFLTPLIPLRQLMDAHRQELLNNPEYSQVVYRFTGDTLFESGQFDRFHYYLLSGDIKLVNAVGDTTCVQGRGSFSPIDPQQPRSCTAVAASDITLLKVHRERLEQLLCWSQAAEHLFVDLASQRERDEDAVWLDTVLHSNLFLKVPPTNVGKILQQLTTRVVNAGETIIRQGETGDCCYFIKEGEAEVSRTLLDGNIVHVADIAEGRCFGEDALIKSTVRNAHVTMKRDGVLLVLSKDDFLPLLKELPVERIDFEQVQKTPRILLDVRTEPEYSQEHLQEAVNLPLHLIHLKHRLLSDRQAYVTCCNTGVRARTACYFLQQLGYNVVALEEGLETLMPELDSAHWTQEDFILRQGTVLPGQ